ncbi:MAG: hypothetical protein KDC38_02295 [Planctomycetes bacterium]|nr:hypothetical protein [Planctomycetota bacterium]
MLEKPKVDTETSRGAEADFEAAHSGFVRSLTVEEQQLLILRDELYDGSWEDMRRDLEDRRDGKPYIYKLIHRIEEDLQRIERLSGYEREHSVNLGEFLDE